MGCALGTFASPSTTPQRTRTFQTPHRSTRANPPTTPRKCGTWDLPSSVEPRELFIGRDTWSSSPPGPTSLNTVKVLLGGSAHIEQVAYQLSVWVGLPVAVYTYALAVCKCLAIQEEHALGASRIPSCVRVQLETTVRCCTCRITIPSVAFTWCKKSHAEKGTKIATTPHLSQQ